MVSRVGETNPPQSTNISPVDIHDLAGRRYMMHDGLVTRGGLSFSAVLT